MVTIDASDASGNPLGQSSEVTLAGSLAPSAPNGVGGSVFANVSSGDNADLGALSAIDSAEGGNLAAVPEPTTLVLMLLALSSLVGQRLTLAHDR